MTTRFLLALPLALVASHAAAQDLPELSVALGVDDAGFNVTTSSVFRLAQDLGYFEKHGVEVTFVPLDGTPQAVAALQAGAVDAADISLDAAIRLRASNDIALRGVVAVSTGSPFLMAAIDEIEGPEDLAGRTYAIADNGSLDHSLTQAALQGLGLDPAGPAYVAIGAPAVRVQALAAGQVEATTVSFGTYGAIEGTPGFHVIVDPTEFSQFAPAVTKFVAIGEETIAEKDDAILRFTMALMDVSRAMAADPEGWIEMATAARSDLPPEAIARNGHFLSERFCVNGCLDPAEVESSIAFIYANPEFADIPPVTADDLVSYSFVDRAMEALGTAGGTGLDARN